MSLLYRFRIDRMEKTTRVDNWFGDTIGFVDNDRQYSQKEILELMHKGYRQGRLDGIEEKAKDIRKKLDI